MSDYARLSWLLLSLRLDINDDTYIHQQITSKPLSPLSPQVDVVVVTIVSFTKHRMAASLPHLQVHHPTCTSTPAMRTSHTHTEGSLRSTTGARTPVTSPLSVARAVTSCRRDLSSGSHTAALLPTLQPFQSVERFLYGFSAWQGRSWGQLFIAGLVTKATGGWSFSSQIRHRIRYPAAVNRVRVQ